MSRAIVAVSVYVSTILAANAAIILLPPVPVAPGVLAPAGVIFAGLAFTARDIVQRRAGRRAMLLGVGVGVGLSAALAAATDSGERVVIASAVAFAIGELADWGAFELLSRRFLLAVAVSGLLGLVVDSLIFLPIAFGSLAFLPGQLIGKGYALLGCLAVLALRRSR